MLAKVAFSVLAVSTISGFILTGVDAFHWVEKQFFAQNDKRINTPTGETETRSNIFPLPQISETAGPTDPTTEATIATPATPLNSGVLEEENVPVVRPPIVEVPVSAEIVDRGTPTKTWHNNSWGVDIRKDEVAGESKIKFTSPWAAYSLYSSGFDLRGQQSIKLDITTPADATTSLYLSLYQGKNRLGSVPLLRYSVGTSTLFHVPLSDMELVANYATDVVLESEFPGTIAIRSIAFSPEIVESRIPQSATVSATETIPDPAPQALSPIIEPEVYFAGLQNEWVMTPRRASVDLLNEERSVTGNAIKVRFDTTTSAISFFNLRGYRPEANAYLHIKVYGGVTDHLWQQLFVTVFDVHGVKLGTTDIAGFSGRGRIVNQTWNEFEIPLRALNAENAIIGTIDIENGSVTQEGDSVWIDDVRFGQY